jgi:uncharacterized protein (TIGR03067 family)
MSPLPTRLVRAALVSFLWLPAACSGPAHLSPGTTRTVQTTGEKKPLGRLNGVWTPVAVERDGCALEEDRWEHRRWEFTGSKVVITCAGVGGRAPVIREWPVYLDHREEPWFMDLEDSESPLTGFAAIYRFDGESLVVCWNVGRLRPSSFATNTGATRVTFRKG